MLNLLALQAEAAAGFSRPAVGPVPVEFILFGTVLAGVNRLPAASSQTTFGLGFLSSVLDNIPLTALALAQGGYDWGFVAFAVGYGGSMIWFGSSAGVALSSMYPEARNAGQYLKHGWFGMAACVFSFLLMLQVLGFRPGSTPGTVHTGVADAAVEVQR